MNSCRIQLVGAVIALLALPVSAQDLQSTITVSEVDEEGKVAAAQLATSGRVGIDSRLLIRIDTRKLETIVSPTQAAPDPKLAARLEIYESALTYARGLADAYGTLLPRLQTDPKTLRATPEGRAFTQKGMAFFNLVGAKKDDLGATYQQINEILENGTADPAREFREITSLLATELEKLNKDLGERLAKSKYDLGMVARHYTVAGKTEGVRLPGYAEGPECAPTRFERFNLLPDERAKQEVEFADKLAPIANDIISGKFTTDAQALLDEVKAALRSLSQDVHPEELDALIVKVRAIATSKASVKALLGRITTLRERLADLERLTTPNTEQEAAEYLLAIATRTATLLKGVQDLLVELPTLLAAIEKDLGATTTDITSAIKQEAQALLIRLRAVATTRLPTLEKLRTRVDDVLSLLAHASLVREPAQRLAEQAAHVKLDALRDTSITLQTLCLRRSPGDVIQLVVSLYDPNGNEKEVSERWYRVDVFGVFVETRGFLAFVDPRGTVPDVTTQPPSFAAAPGLGWFLHRGFRDKPVLNDLLRPGVGISLLALNFKQQGPLELGIAGGIVILKDLLHVGYGRNLQAKTNFIYVGINPLAFGNLFTDTKPARTAAP